jgi:hypothetical protein
MTTAVNRRNLEAPAPPGRHRSTPTRVLDRSGARQEKPGRRPASSPRRGLALRRRGLRGGWPPSQPTGTLDTAKGQVDDQGGLPRHRPLRPGPIRPGELEEAFIGLWQVHTELQRHSPTAGETVTSRSADREHEIVGVRRNKSRPVSCTPNVTPAPSALRPVGRTGSLGAHLPLAPTKPPPVSRPRVSQERPPGPELSRSVQK